MQTGRTVRTMVFYILRRQKLKTKKTELALLYFTQLALRSFQEHCVFRLIQFGVRLFVLRAGRDLGHMVVR